MRLSNKQTQKEAAKLAGVGRTSWINYEAGKQIPRGDKLDKIANLFQVSLEALMHENLSQRASSENLHSSGPKAFLASNGDRSGVTLIPATAKASYAKGYADKEYLASLPEIYLPELKHGNFRAFTIEGDSMPPIHDGFIVVGKAVENKSELVPKLRYIFVLKSEGILFKRLSDINIKQRYLTLSSDNPDYSSFSMSLEEILEVWSFHLFIGYPQDYKSPLMELEWRIDRLTEMVKNLITDSQK